MSIEKRVGMLESQFEYIRRDLNEIRVDVAVLKERVDHLPTKEWTAKLVVGAMGVGFTAVVTLVATAPKLWAWMGVLPPILGSK